MPGWAISTQKEYETLCLIFDQRNIKKNFDRWTKLIKKGKLVMMNKTTNQKELVVLQNDN